MFAQNSSRSFVRTSRSCRTPIWSRTCPRNVASVEAQFLEHPLRARLRLHHLGHHLLEARLQGVEEQSLARRLPIPFRWKSFATTIRIVPTCFIHPPRFLCSVASATMSFPFQARSG